MNLLVTELSAEKARTVGVCLSSPKNGAQSRCQHQNFWQTNPNTLNYRRIPLLQTHRGRAGGKRAGNFVDTVRNQKDAPLVPISF
jgi:hypothetical protein